MKTNLSGLALGLVMAAAMADAALAGGDVIYQGVKDAGAAVPVPAPIPVADYEPEYYARIDVGASWLSDGEIEEVGTPLEVREPGDIEAIEFGSIGIGRYITPSIRAEIAVDLYNRADISEPNSYYYTDTLTAEGPTDQVTGIPTVDTSNYNVERSERVKLEQNAALFNLYYDFRNSTRFTPYIGGGFGVTYREMRRTTRENAECFRTDNSNPVVDAGYGDNFCRDTDELPRTFTHTSEETKGRWDFAAAAMAGFSFEIYDNVLLDTSYRYLWQNGTLTMETETLTGMSRVSVSDTHQHQFRTGLRININ
ncbi:MAG: outer membrane beta-barrel protein [Hyphomicrobium sp.]|nr:outer membrane beta-barrel protein [Hyphomicrobium sp.]